ncbi:MAG: cation:proton antiporter [Armatimonadota bacterium]
MGEGLSVANSIILILVVVSAVAIIARRLKVPYTVALVLAGLGISLFGVHLQVELDEQLLMHLLLPALLFEGSTNLNAVALRREAVPILVLAVPGTLVCMLIVGSVVHYLFALHWAVALLFGAVIAPTDPIAVLATFRQLGIAKRLSVIVEGESLFNDGVAIVISRIFMVLAAGYLQTKEFGMSAEGISVLVGVRQFLLVSFGGAAVGLACGFAVSLITRQIDDHLVEITLSTIGAYGTFLLAEHFGVSGPISVIVCGVVLGNFGRRVGMSPTTRLAFVAFWEYAGFIANSVVFVLMGLAIQVGQLWRSGLQVMIAFLVVLLARAVVIYGSGLLLRARATGHQIPLPWQHLMTWSALKGALSMVLALGAAHYDRSGFILTATFGVALVSILAQGLTMRGLVRALGLAHRPEALLRHELLTGGLLAKRAALEELRGMAEMGLVSREVRDSLASEYENERARLEQLLADTHADSPFLVRRAQQEALSQTLLREKDAILDAFYRGVIGQEALEDLLSDVDQRMASAVGEHDEREEETRSEDQP